MNLRTETDIERLRQAALLLEQEVERRDRFEVIIVGCGIAGASLAYFLAERGMSDVLILEREDQPGYHATGRSAGVLVEIDPVPSILALKLQAAPFLREPPSGFAEHPLLERSGILAQLRSKGFRALRVELDTRNGAAHTLRVVCDEGPEELLLELRAGRSRSAVPDMEVIFVEWLLLQNPRAEFSARRPQLPGQQHPGLGLLRDVNGHEFLLHDGRARGMAEAILWHGGEAEASREAFRALDAAKREALLTFLRSL